MKTRHASGTATIWFVIILLVIMGFGGYRVGSLYMDHSAIENEVAAMGDDALMRVRRQLDPEDWLRERVKNRLQAYGVSLTNDDIEVAFDRAQGKIYVKCSYTRWANLIITRVPVSFDLAISRENQKARGIILQFQNNVEQSYSGSERRYQEGLKKSLGQ